MPDVFIHERALCESDDVGDGTRIWAFAHVLPGARIGRDCNICDGVFIEGGATIGDRVTVKPGVQLWDGVELADDVFVGPNVTFTNDHFPRSRKWPDAYARTTVQRGASIGANATVLPGVIVGVEAMVGAGAVVTRSVPPHAIVVGNPARIVGYSGDQVDSPVASSTVEVGRSETGVAGVSVHRFLERADLRGTLTAGALDAPDGVPFAPQRWFLVYDVPTREVRGEHAHRTCHQFLVCVKGTVNVVADDGEHRAEILLDSPTTGIHLPPLVWGTQYRYDPDAVLLVFASHPYDPDDYIREYDAFLTERRTARD